VKVLNGILFASFALVLNSVA